MTLSSCPHLAGEDPGAKSLERLATRPDARVAPRGLASDRPPTPLGVRPTFWRMVCQQSLVSASVKGGLSLGMRRGGSAPLEPSQVTKATSGGVGWGVAEGTEKVLEGQLSKRPNGAGTAASADSVRLFLPPSPSSLPSPWLGD